MNIDDKYKEWNEIFWNNFIIPSKGGQVPGTNIPLGSIDFDSKVAPLSDGTIQMADLLQYLYTFELLNDIDSCPISVIDVLKSLKRLSTTAYEYYRSKFPNIYIPYQSGFFLRDDFSSNDADDLNLTKIISSYIMLNEGVDEDPCHSPFVSQDQVWNLNPILRVISTDSFNSEESEMAIKLGLDMNYYIKDNSYTIYNPYLSSINHYFKYLPSLNENKVKPWERISDRNNHLEFTDKVKRGANNWYYSGGTSSCCDSFCYEEKDYFHTFRTFIYRGVVFFLDRIYEPLYKLISKSDFKHNSYYCYALTSGIWYNKGFEKRLAKRFNESLESENVFEHNIAFLMDDKSLIDWNKVYKWMENYKEPDLKGTVYNPLPFLYTYNWYKLYGGQ